MTAAKKARSRALEAGVEVAAHGRFHWSQVELEARDSYTHYIQKLSHQKKAIAKDLATRSVPHQNLQCQKPSLFGTRLGVLGLGLPCALFGPPLGFPNTLPGHPVRSKPVQCSPCALPEPPWASMSWMKRNLQIKQQGQSEKGRCGGSHALPT